MRQLNSHEPLKVGQTTTFECVTTGSRPQASIHWFFQGQRHDSPMNGKCVRVRAGQKLESLLLT